VLVKCECCGTGYVVASLARDCCGSGGPERLYVAGPMSGIEDYNFPAFNEAARLLRAAGYSVENPADTGVREGWEWHDYLRSAIGSRLVRCDGVATLPGWKQSRGALLEVYIAEALGMPVLDLDSWLPDGTL
jgi:hypothetical protein